MQRKNDVRYKSEPMIYQLTLSPRAYAELKKGWAGYFRSDVMPLINEDIFAPLYSDKKSRPGIPVNVLIGLMIIADMQKCTFEQAAKRTAFDFEIKYALYLDDADFDFETCYKTIQRFLHKCVVYEAEHDVDLIHECFIDLTNKQKKIMGINGRLMRIDSLMIDDNVRTMTRVDLLYTVIEDEVLELAGIVRKRPKQTYTKIPFRNPQTEGQLSFNADGLLSEETSVSENSDSASEDDNVDTLKNRSLDEVKELIANSSCPDLPEALYHYVLRDDHNAFIYHDQEHSSDSKISSLLRDAKVLVDFCGDRCKDNAVYQMLMRVLNEQCIRKEDGSFELRKTGDPELNSGICQNPYAPESTYCWKDGHSYRGDKSTIVEQSSSAGDSLIAEYQYGSNTESDDAQGAAIVDRLKQSGQTQGSLMVGDGLFNGTKMQEALKNSGMTIQNTNLPGRQTADVHADHKLDPESGKLIECAGGQKPLTSKRYSNGQTRSLMCLGICMTCPHYRECYSNRRRKQHQEALNKAMKAGKTSADVHVDMLTSLKSNLRASQNRQRNSDYFRECSCYRNGIEAKVSDLRRNYQVDNLPPIGRGARKLLFGLSVMASNTKSQIRCGQRKVIEKLFPSQGGNYTLQTV